MDDVEKFIVDHLKKEYEVKANPTDSLALLGVDSVAMAELTFVIERQFSIRVDDDILDVDTIEDFANYIRKRQANR